VLLLLLAADDFEDMELLYPLYWLAEGGIEVTVAGLDGLMATSSPVRHRYSYGLTGMTTPDVQVINTTARRRP
jgi:putative intracellular protease/amidase